MKAKKNESTNTKAFAVKHNGVYLEDEQIGTSSSAAEISADADSSPDVATIQNPTLFKTLIPTSSVSLSIVGDTIGLKEKRQALEKFVLAPTRFKKSNNKSRRSKSYRDFNNLSLLNKISRVSSMMKQQVQKAINNLAQFFEMSHSGYADRDETSTIETNEYENCSSVPFEVSSRKSKNIHTFSGKS